MAPPRGRGGGLKSWYRQTKKGTGAATKAKPPAPSSKRKPSKNSIASQVAADDAGGGYGAEEEEELRQFDMDMSYGPCIGVTRLRRWERAAAMGLSPSPHLRDLILRHHHGHGSPLISQPPPKISKSAGGSGSNGDDDVCQLECLWAGKV